MSEEKGQEALSWRRLPLETKYDVGIRAARNEIGAFRMLILELLGPEKAFEALDKFYRGLAHKAYQEATAKGILKGNSIKDIASFLYTMYDSYNIPVEVEVTDERVRLQYNKTSPELCAWGIPKGDDRLCCGIGWTQEFLKLINPKLRAYLSKTKRWGDEWCEEVIELKED